MSAPIPFCKFFRDDSGIDLTNDYSGGSADDAVLAVTESDVSHYEVHEIIFSWVLGAEPNYGIFLGDATLANGFAVKVYDAADDEVEDLTDGDVIKDNNGLYKRSNSPMFWTTDTSFTPDRHHGQAIWKFKEPLILRAGEEIRAELADDLSNAANLKFEIIANGRRFDR